MDHKDARHFRLHILAILFFAVMAVYLGVLFNTQVNHYDEYYASSIRTIARPETVEAARGDITDRNGKVMVSSRPSYSLTFDASELDSDEKMRDAVLKNTVFGRVTPNQKRKFVQILKDAGHTVAMTGDGVNDVLALKDADCSIAMASGSDAAAQASQLVLLESDFSCMPQVVLEGRRVVNNIQRSATLFLVKNIFSFLRSLISVVFMFTYPLEPSQISLISMFTIGVPAFFLALEPNKNRIKGHFLTNVFLKALPAAITDALAVGALVIFGETFHVDSTDISTAATMLLAIVGFMILYKISAPLNVLRTVILCGCIAGLLFCSIYLNDLFAITGMTTECVMLFVVFAIATEPVLRYLTILVGKLRFYYQRLRGRNPEEEQIL